MKDILFYYHIPRCGGGMVTPILADKVKPKITASSGDFLYSPMYCREPGFVPALISGMNSLSDIQRDAIGGFVGHVPFGMHVFLNRPCSCLTLLRDPVERMVSCYKTVKKTPKHPLYDLAVTSSLTGYVQHPRTVYVLNDQVRLLSGAQLTLPEFADRMMTEHALLRAEENLQKGFVAFGFVEAITNTLELFSRVLGWKETPSIRKKHDASSYSSKLSSGEIKVIEQHNALDVELYEFAGKLFAERFNECLL